MSARNPADVDHLFGERVNAADLEGTVALYEAGATLVASDAGPQVGHDAIRAYLAGLIALAPTIDMGAVRTVALGDDLAVLHHDWHATFKDPNGQPVQMTGKATEIVRRQKDGSWLFLFDDPNLRD